MDDAEDREFGERAHVVQRLAGPAAPALVPGDEAGVEDQAEEGEPVSDARGDGCGEEAPFQRVDEEVVQCRTDGGRDQQNVTSGSHDLLRLEILLHGFEVDESESAGDEAGEELGAVGGELLGLAEGEEERFGEDPQEAYRDVEEAEDDEGALEKDA